jgi:hypothetical protein
VNCDDYGRFDARPAVLKSRLFPLKKRITEKEITSALTHLENAGCIVLYEHSGRPYLYLPTWELHQTIRAKKSKFPAPDNSVKTSEIICKQMQADVPVIQSNTIQSYSESESESKECACAQYTFSPELQTAVESWMAYKKEMRKPYKPQGMNAFLKKVNEAAEKHGEQAVIRAIEESMSNGWQGVVWEKLDKPKGEKKPWEKVPRALDYPQRKYTAEELESHGIGIDLSKLYPDDE